MVNKSPIYFVNLTGRIKNARNKTFIVVEVKKMVVKGTDEQIKNSDDTKISFLKSYFKTWKKVKDFDIERLEIVDIEIIESLGYGTKI